MPVSPSLPRRIPLSQQDMVAISQAISRDFSPRFVSRRQNRSRQSQFTPQELREISRQISRDFAPTPISDKSRLVLLAVTPRKLHVYWQIAKQRLLRAIEASASPTASNAEAPQLTLRIYPPSPTRDEVATATPPTEPSWLEISINQWQGQLDVPLPETLVDHGNHSPANMPYHAVLGQVDQDHHFEALAYSNPVITSLPARPAPADMIPPELMAYIMLPSSSSSSTGKTASGQGK